MFGGVTTPEHPLFPPHRSARTLVNQVNVMHAYTSVFFVILVWLLFVSARKKAKGAKLELQSVMESCSLTR